MHVVVPYTAVPMLGLTPSLWMERPATLHKRGMVSVRVVIHCTMDRAMDIYQPAHYGQVTQHSSDTSVSLEIMFQVQLLAICIVCSVHTFRPTDSSSGWTGGSSGSPAAVLSVHCPVLPQEDQKR